MTIDLKQQIEQEQNEIINAPRVYSSALQTRCHFCGAVGGEVVFVERVGDGKESPIVERYKGVACCGA